jgi:hypothetical protein
VRQSRHSVAFTSPRHSAPDPLRDGAGGGGGVEVRRGGGVARERGGDAVEVGRERAVGLEGAGHAAHLPRDAPGAGREQRDGVLTHCAQSRCAEGESQIM